MAILAKQPVKINRLRDPHCEFSDLAAKHQWLAIVERRVRNARIRTIDELHRAFGFVHRICQRRLPEGDSIVADLHLSRLVDDAAEVSL